MCAFVVLVVLLVLMGYDHTTAARHTINTILHAAQSIIILTIVFNLIFNFRFTLKTTRIFKWIVDIGMLITLLPVLYPQPEHPCVVFTTFTILITSSLLFFIIESSHSMSGMSLYERTVQSVFNSLTPPSAGFISIPVADFMPLTLFIVMIQMWTAPLTTHPKC